MARLIELDNRAVIKLSGTDTDSFLQGLISNDMNKLRDDNLLYAALLTPQGKFLYDFFLKRKDGNILLDVAADKLDEIISTLKKYLLRRDVVIERTKLKVFADIDGESGFMDPRNPSMGSRLLGNIYSSHSKSYDEYVKIEAESPILRAEGSETKNWQANSSNDKGISAKTSKTEYDLLRLKLTIPDGIEDMEFEKTLLLEARFDEINGVDFNKGCYVGQEVTTRSKFRGNIRKKLLGLKLVKGTMPAYGTEICANGNSIGEMRSSAGEYGIALMQLDACEKADQLQAGNSVLMPYTNQT